MSASTFKRFTQSALEQFNPAAADAAAASTFAKCNAASLQAPLETVAGAAADAIALNAAAATAGFADAKAIGLAAVPW